MKISLFYKHVTVLDYAYLDEHEGAMGHSQIVDVEFLGKTDDEGVVYDFSYAKKKVKEIIDRECDHRFVVPAGLVDEKEGRGYLNYEFGYSDIPLEYWGPTEAFCKIPYKNVSDATIVSYLENLIMEEMPETVLAVRLKLREEIDSENSAYFKYTHGLKEHYGNCQRLIHGHRSTVKVYTNGVRDIEKEKLLAETYFSSNIHFCFWENVVNKDEILEAEGKDFRVGRLASTPVVHMKYQASQGVFETKYPGKFVFITENDSTVENLSIHFCQLLKDKYCKAGETIRVEAFEGIGKGAISTMIC